MAYLDYAGAGKPSVQQMKDIAESLQRLNLSNPHSRHQSGKYTANVIERVRDRILRHFNVSSDSHDVIFTSGATEALRIVAESFDFGEPEGTCRILDGVAVTTQGIFVYMMDAHTSVVGMREVVKSRCNAVCVVKFEDLQNLQFNCSSSVKNNSNDLFVITAMSNFCGRKYPLDIIEKLHSWRKGNCFVCVDAAAWVSSSDLDLSYYKADFVAVSFYKMFGFPTGIGALIVRRDASHLLHKHFFGGGTVRLLIPNEFIVFRKNDLAQRFEDGTLNFWGIAALEQGFKDLDAFGGMQKIEQNTHVLACALRKVLDLKHKNGTTIAKIYGHKSGSSSSLQGPIVTFNLLRDDGSYIGYSEVDKMCSLYEIELRTGCFCNQGACQKYLEISPEEQLLCFQDGKECGDSRDLYNGKPLGAVRISFGRQSTMNDVKLFQKMLQSCFLSKSSGTRLSKSDLNLLPRLMQISLYPVKSCAAFTPKSWTLCLTGLNYDRFWMVTSQDSSTLSLKNTPRLHLIKPRIENRNLLLCSNFAEFPNICVPLDCHQRYSTNFERVCSDSVETLDCGDEVSHWLSSVLQIIGCRLKRKVEDSSKPPISLSNEAPYLLINKESVAQIALAAGLSVDEAIKRFRANFVIDNIEAFSEDKIARIQIGKVWFKVVGKCTRCQIICIDPETGLKDPHVMIALRNHRLGTKMTFGVYLQHENCDEGNKIVVGMSVNIIWQ